MCPWWRAEIIECKIECKSETGSQESREEVGPLVNGPLDDENACKTS